MYTKKTAEDKQKKQLEEKVLKSELAKKEEDVKDQEKQQKLAIKMKKEMELKKEVERQGWSKIDLSVLKLRVLPLEVYATAEARHKLQYAISTDLSINELDNLPPVFLECMKACQQLCVAQNRLKHIPAEIAFMANLLILDLHANQLVDLPTVIGDLKGGVLCMFVCFYVCLCVYDGCTGCYI
jgi:hypothetical protein